MKIKKSEPLKPLKALEILEKYYREQCREAGYPCDYIVDEGLYHAIEKLKHVLKGY